MRYAMAIDTKKCVGCADCVVACQTENNVPIGYCRDWIVENTAGTYPRLELEIRSERCNHCKNSPCVRCCPTGASHYAEGGTLSIDGRSASRPGIPRRPSRRDPPPSCGTPGRLGPA